MSNLAPIQTTYDSKSLESILETLSKYGHPRLGKDKDGWYCHIDMFVSGQGTEFKSYIDIIRSDWNHPTPITAAGQALTRVKEQYGVKVD